LTLRTKFVRPSGRRLWSSASKTLQALPQPLEFAV